MRLPRRFPLRAFGASLAVCVLGGTFACAKQNKPADEPIGVSAAPVRGSKAERRRVLARPLVTLRGATLGPYMARQGDGFLLAYVSSAESELVAMPLLPDGAPSGSAKILGRIPAETNALALRPLGRDGFAILLRKPNDRGETLEIVGVQKDGSPFGKLAPLSSSQGRIVWFDVLRTGAGSVAVWAEDGESSDITLFSQPLEANGKPIGVPMRVGKRAVSWTAAGGGNGAGIAWITRESALAAEGPLLLQRFDKQGQLAGTPVTVAAKARARGEVDMVYANSAYVLGWTDGRENPPQALVASVPEQGAAEAPRALVRRAKSSDLAGMISSSSGAWLAAWRDGVGTAGGLQGRLSVGTAGSDPSSILHVSPRDRVFGSMNGRGSAWLLTARPCQANELTCEAPYEPELHVLEGNDHRVIRLEEESSQAFSVAWDLSCDDTYCVNLAASPGNPTTVYSVSTSLLDRLKDKGPAVEAALGSAVVAEASGAPVALAAQGSLVAWLAEMRNPGRFAVQVLPVNAELDVPKNPPPLLTQAALLAGGLSMASGPKDDGAVVGWVADDNQVSHVHLARVDKAGQRKNHVLLTQQKGDKSSVCVVRTSASNGKSNDTGYVVFWVDERSADPQIYATRVTQDLARVARETKLTEAPGDKSELGCVQSGDKVVLTWVDTRDDPSHTRGDIYTLNLRPQDLSVSGGDRAVLATAPRSFAPLLRMRGTEPVVSWIESGAAPNESFLYETSLAAGTREAVRRRIPAVVVGLVPRPGDRVAALVTEGRRLVLYDEAAPNGDKPGEMRRVGWLLDSPAPGTPAASTGTHLLFGEAGPQPGVRALAFP